MAVEIPVFVDIEGAFKDAARRVSGAMQTMQRAVDEKSLEVIVQVDKKGTDFAQVIDFVGKTTKSMSQLKFAIKSVEDQLSALAAKTGGNVDLSKGEGKALSEAYVILNDILAQRKMVTREIKNSVQETIRQAQAEREHQAVLSQTSNSLSDINAKISAWRKELETSTIGSKQFGNAAVQVGLLSSKLEKVNALIKLIGSNGGSINFLNTRLQELNRQYNELSPSKRKGAEGNALLDQYRRVTNELEKEGRSLQKIIQDEQRRAQAIANATQKRRYENAILNATTKTMRVLQEQERILSERLGRTAVGSSAYERLKTQLQGVRKEIEAINIDLAGTKTQTANLDVLLGNADNKLANLVKRSIYLVGLHSATRFIRNIREVTSEFEMQRVALAGIIQDTSQAETLFRQIKAAAIKSPFEIKELVTFTKQLSAYRIETDKLFDVTMKLADVSAGLGVDMNRLVLAYGQVRAASVLRGQELRQFTEAGIPLVELLADKFTELNGRMVSTADVFDLISKRAVPFSMIEEIFNDMTESGGMFYKMQEKQSETLLGQWQKLKDALSIMYDEMGNTSVVHGAMEKMFSDAMRLMQNWRLIGGVVKSVGLQFVALKVFSAFVPSLTRNVTLAKRAQDMFSKSLAASEMAAKTGSASFRRASDRFLSIATHLEKASLSTNLFTQSQHRLAAFFKGGGWIGLAATALTSIIGYIVAARKEAERLGKELQQNVAKGALQIQQAERNFRRLADAAVQAADGSSEQREVMKELKRSYGDIIPAQDLEIAKLKELKGNYDSLTDAIRQKIEMQIHEQNMNQITDSFGSSIGASQRRIEKYLKSVGGFTTEEAARIIKGITSAIDGGLISSKQQIGSTLSEIGNIIKEQTGRDVDHTFLVQLFDSRKLFSFRSDFEKLIKDTEMFSAALDDEQSRYEALENKMGRYADVLKGIREELKKAPEGFTLAEAGTFEFNQAKWKQAVDVYKKTLVDLFRDANADIDLSDAFSVDNYIDFDEIFKHISDGENTKELKAFVDGVQKDYLNIAPQDKTTRLVTQAAIGFADDVGIAMSKVQGYLKKDETAMEDYAKSVNDFVEAQKKRIHELEFTQSNYREGISNYVRPTDDQIANEKQELSFLKKLLEFVNEFLQKKGPGGGDQQDPWILLYKNRMKFMQDFRKGVEDLNKYMSNSDALLKERGVMEGRGASLGFDVKELDGSRKELLDWYDSVIADITKKIGELGGRTWENLGVQAILAKDTKSKTLKAYQDLLADVFKERTDFDLSQQKRDLEEAIKKLSDEIKRSETAKNFYDNILDLTGDKDLAATMSVSLYDDTGNDLQEKIKRSLAQSFVLDDLKLSTDNIDVSSAKAEVAKALSAWDLKTLVKYLPYVVDQYQASAKEILDSQNKAEADYLAGLYKTYQKTKTYEERITDIRKKEAEARAKIEADTNLPQDEKESKTNASRTKEAQEVASVLVEQIKDTYEWGKAFEDLDRVGNITLNNLREKIEALIAAQKKNLTPEQLKALTDALEKVKETQATRDPIGTIVQSWRDVKTLSKQFEAAKKEGSDMTGVIEDGLRDANKQMELGIQGVADYMSQWQSVVDTLSDAFNLEEVPILGETMQGISDSLGFVAKILPVIITLNAILNKTLMVNPILAAGATVVATVGAIAGLIKGIVNAKIEKLNNEFKEQERILDRLEESYEIIGNVIEDSFGNDYVYNYNEQLKNLQAQQEAYIKQAENREKAASTAKKKDDVQQFKEEAEEARRSAAEVGRAISDLTKDAQSAWAGTSLADAAKSFADSWLDAYKEFGSTSDAIEERMQEMVENIITKAALSGVAQAVLQPWFEELDDITDWDSSKVAEMVNKAYTLVPMLNDGLSIAAAKVTEAGVNLRNQVGSFTGISRNIATASEESILGLAAGINTQNYYISHVPTISENVAKILAALTGTEHVSGLGEASAATIPYVESEIFMGQMSNIDQNLASLLSALNSVITAKNQNTNTHCIAIK